MAHQARLRASRSTPARTPDRDDNPSSQDLFGEPREVNKVGAALACFQWGILAYRGDRLARAIEWLERAIRLEGRENYWYHFLVGYLEDKAGYIDDALSNYKTAAALRPSSPWVLFS